MARIILQNSNINLDLEKRKTVSTGYISEKELLEKRSKKYLDLIAGIDSKTLTDTKGMQELLETLQEELGVAELASLPLGIVAKCFLGYPYEVHTLDLSGSQIIKHYKVNEVMEADFEKARSIAKHNAYVMVEVYKDKMLLIHNDGTVTKL